MNNDIQALVSAVAAPDAAAMERARARQDSLAKPPHSLGKLEDISVKLAGVTGELYNPVDRRRVLIGCAIGAAVITLELASRFLMDYLMGDKYFRIDYPDQNLKRAQAQLKLFQDMMLHMDDMRAIIREIAGQR